MNKKQTIIMWVGIVVFILFGSFTQTGWTHRDRITHKWVSATDYAPLVIRLTSTVFVTGGLIVTFRDKKPPDKQ